MEDEARKSACRAFIRASNTPEEASQFVSEGIDADERILRAIMITDERRFRDLDLDQRVKEDVMEAVR